MNDLTSAGVELAVVVAYGRIIPARLLERDPDGEPALLAPAALAWRGPGRARHSGRRPRDGRLPHEGRGGARYRSRLRRAPRATGRRQHARRGARASWWPSASALVVETLAHGVSGLPDPVPQEGEVTMADKISADGPPSRLELDGDRTSSGSSGSAGPGRRSGARGCACWRPGSPRAGTARATTGFRAPSTARSSRPGAEAWCCGGCSPRAVLPCQPRSGCAACACARRAPRDGLDMGAVTVTPIDGWSPDQYERFRSERQQPFDDLLALCHPVRGRSHCGSRVRHGRPDQDPARGDGGQGDGRHRLVARHVGPGPVDHVA